jgi:hypothetical protein
MLETQNNNISRIDTVCGGTQIYLCILARVRNDLCSWYMDNLERAFDFRSADL